MKSTGARILLIILIGLLSGCARNGNQGSVAPAQETPVASPEATSTIELPPSQTAEKLPVEDPTATSTLLHSPSPPVADETPTPAQAVQIGVFSSIYLRYDADRWEPFIEEGMNQQTNPNGEFIYALRHKELPGCVLHDNLGRGAPATWQRQDSDRFIGSLEYRVESWIDTTTGLPVLVVYQFPKESSNSAKRIELVIDQDPESCIQDAEVVLVASEDLIE